MRTEKRLAAADAPVPPFGRPRARSRLALLIGLLITIAAATSGCGGVRAGEPAGGSAPEPEPLPALALGTQSGCLPRFPDQGERFPALDGEGRLAHRMHGARTGAEIDTEIADLQQ